MPPKKRLAMAIADKMSPMSEEMDDSGSSETALKAAASDLISALAAKDAARVASVLKSFIYMCDDDSSEAEGPSEVVEY